MNVNYFYFLVIVFLTSCMSAKKYSGIVESGLQKNVESSMNENIFFDISSLDSSQVKVSSKIEKSTFIPAILFWQWNKTISCKLNQRYCAAYIQDRLNYYIDSLNIEEKLEGRKFNIRIDKVPNNFVYIHKGSLTFLLFIYVIKDIEFIYSQDQKLELDYKVLQDEVELDKGKIILKTKNEVVGNKSASTKKLTHQYIVHFKSKLDLIAKELAFSLLTKI